MRLRCTGSRSCATSYGTEIAVTPALTLYFATSDEAVDAVSLLERMRGR